MVLLQPAAQPPPVKFHIAPMQCYTNRHLRDLLGRLCPAAVLWTEMEKTTDLATEAARHRRLWHRQTERHVVLQLGGDDPKQLAAAARHAARYGYAEVNLNCGCPSVEAGGADFGAALMRRPDATRRMLEEMAAAAGGVPVSLKCRVGTHERPVAGAAPPVDEYEPLAEFVQAVSHSGAVRRSEFHNALHNAFRRPRRARAWVVARGASNLPRIAADLPPISHRSPTDSLRRPAASL